MFSSRADRRDRTDRRADHRTPRRGRPFRPDLLGMEKLKPRMLLAPVSGNLTITLSGGS